MPASLSEIVAATRRRVAEVKLAADVRQLERQAESHVPRGFERALRAISANGPAVIAELKRASPSRGLIRSDFDAAKLQAYPPGAVIVLPSDTSHFHWAKSGEYVTQVTAIGPLGLEYVDADRDGAEHLRGRCVSSLPGPERPVHEHRRSGQQQCPSHAYP